MCKITWSGEGPIKTSRILAMSLSGLVRCSSRFARLFGDNILSYFTSFSPFPTFIRLAVLQVQILIPSRRFRLPLLVFLPLPPPTKRKNLPHQRRPGGRRLLLLQHKCVSPWDYFVLLVLAFASSITASHVFMPTTPWRIYALRMLHKYHLSARTCSQTKVMLHCK